MSQEYKNPLSNISYTNKDFQTIYKELLDLVKQLTNKWDPSISNESDPGVILLKLNAIIADKCNYNIDKNVLECFPVSVTQLNNARKLFEQLGYYMHWSLSATTDVMLQWIGESSGKSYTIPAFTMVSDYEGNTVYTLIGSTFSDGFSVSSQQLKDNGEYLSFKAIQGIAVRYDINGQTLITPNMLDSENRLYFPSTDIAENGIFICNANTNNYSSWIKKDNLLVESLGNKFYKFGTTQDQTQCYIEFPMDAEEQFEQGINITYIKTDGEQGNISSNVIEKFYNDLVPEEDTTITLNSDNVRMTNYSSATDGSDYETINDAYDGYKRTVGTFNTLVTLRDYINYINRSGLVSNSFVCDRHNDIQCSYKVMSVLNGVNQEVSYIESNYSKEYKPIELHDGKNAIQTEAMVWEKSLNAFNLKLYALQYQKDVDTDSKYDTTFNMITGSSYQNLKMYLEDIKSINHDILDLVPADETRSNVAYFLNVYPINCTLVSQYALTESDKHDMRENIKKALYQNLNSKEINFGEAIQVDYLSDVIRKSDPRIKNVSIDNIDYTTYACILEKDEKGNDKWSYIDISKDYEITYESSHVLISSIDTGKLLSNISGGEFTFTIDPSTIYFKRCVQGKYSERTYIGEFDSAPNIADVSPLSIYFNTSEHRYYLAMNDTWNAISSSEIQESALPFQSNLSSFYTMYYGWKINGVTVDPYYYGLFTSEILTLPDPEDLTITINIPRALQIRKEIYTKSVLAGVTPFYISDETFDYQLCQKYNSLSSFINNISNFSMWRNLVFENVTPTAKVYKIPTNSSIQLIAPNLLEDKIFSNYVKYEYRLRQDLIKETSYQLGTDEYIIFYWKQEDDEGVINQYAVYGEGNIITSSFTISANAKSGEIDTNIGQTLISNCKNIGVDSVVMYADSATSGDMSWELSSKIDGQLTNIFNKLTGSRKITTKKVNQVKLSYNTYCYWVLNNVNSNNQYELFSKDGEKDYILDTGEYFLYTDNTLSYFNILGAGTTISRSSTEDYWAVNAIDSSEIINNGLVALKDIWFALPLSNSLVVTENQYFTIGSDYYISFRNIKDTNSYDIEFTKSGVNVKRNGIVDNTVDLSDFEIRYGNTADNMVSIPNIDLSTYLNWEGKSIYAVNTSPEKEQFTGDVSIVESGVITDVGEPIQYKFVIVDQDTNESSEIEGSFDSADNLYFMTSIPVDAVNANNIDVTTEQRDGSIQYMSIYTYSKYDNIITDNYTVQYLSNGDVTLTIFPTSTSQTISIPVELYNDSTLLSTYILPISIDTATIENEAISHLSISYYGRQLHSMYSEFEVDFAHTNNSYLYLLVDDVAEDDLRVEISGIKGNNNVVITFKNILKYNLPEINCVSDQVSNKNISTIIGSMSSENRLFDYTYQPFSDYAIDNPLLPASFFKSNHIFNQFTIGKIDTKNINIAIINN